MADPEIAHPPETLEGWFALHQIYRFTPELRAGKELGSLVEKAARSLMTRQPTPAGRKSGWSCFARLIGSTSDLMVMHFRESLEEIGRAQDSLAESELVSCLEPVYSFLSVTEAGLY